jgi:hypothetical protein
MTDIAAFLTSLVTVLRNAVAHVAARESRRAQAAAHLAGPPHLAPEAPAHVRLMRFWAYALRTVQRLDRLVQRWQAGTLPPPTTRTDITAPKKPRPAPLPAAGANQPSTAIPRLPRTRGWVTRLVGHPAAGAASQLQHLLTTPEMAAFLAAAPQAARLLRPFWRMLSPDPLPAPLVPAIPPPPRPKRPPAPPRAKLPKLSFEPWVRAAVRALRKKYG